MNFEIFKSCKYDSYYFVWEKKKKKNIKDFIITEIDHFLIRSITIVLTKKNFKKDIVVRNHQKIIPVLTLVQNYYIVFRMINYQ